MKGKVMVTMLCLDDGDTLPTIVWQQQHKGVIHGTV
jgi:hypothetical protein